MTARPISTFASEGWARPSGARTVHYYRPGGHLGLTSVCGSWQASEGIRPHLTVTPGITTTGGARPVCQRCDRRVHDELRRTDRPWFDEEPR